MKHSIRIRIGPNLISSLLRGGMRWGLMKLFQAPITLFGKARRIPMRHHLMLVELYR